MAIDWTAIAPVTLNDENQYVKVADETNLTDSETHNHGTTDDGIYAQVGIYPEARFDFKGKTKEDWYNAFTSSNANEHVFCLFHHSDYDAEVNNTTYRVNAICKEGTANADNTRGASNRKVRGINTKGKGNEWYIDHISGYNIDASGNVEMSDLKQMPTRTTEDGQPGPEHTGSNDHSFDINFSFDEMLCKPNMAVALISRGYEKDHAEPGSDDYETKAADWIQLMKNFKSVITGGTGCFRFAYNCITMIVRAILSNGDDPMNPIMVMLSQGACRYIHENLGGSISFEFTALGSYTCGAEVTGSVHNHYVQLVESKTSRYCSLSYDLTVTPV